MLNSNATDFRTANYNPAATSAGGFPNPSNLISNSRIYGALNPASLASAIIGASNGNVPTRNAIRESVRSLITVVENAQLDNAMQNMGYGTGQAPVASTPTSIVPTPYATPFAGPAPAAVTSPNIAPTLAATLPTSISISIPTSGILIFPPESAPYAEKQAFYSSPEYYGYAAARAESTAPAVAGNPTDDSLMLGRINSFKANRTLSGYQHFNQMIEAARPRVIISDTAQSALQAARQQAATLGYNVTVDDILTLAVGGNVTFRSNPSAPGQWTSAGSLAASFSQPITVTATSANSTGNPASPTGSPTNYAQTDSDALIVRGARNSVGQLTFQPVAIPVGISASIAAFGSSAVAGGVAPPPTGNQGVKPDEALKRLDLGPEISAALKVLWKELGKATIEYNIEFSYAVYRHRESGKVEYLAAPGEDKASTPFGPKEGYDLLLTGHTHNRPTAGFSGFGFGNGHAAPGPSPDDWTVKGDNPGAIHILNQRTIGGIWSVVIY